MLKTFSTNGMLQRLDYFIHCSFREGNYLFSAIHHRNDLSLAEENFLFTYHTDNLELALEEYCKFLITRVSEEKIKVFYFQGKAVLTVPSASST